MGAEPCLPGDEHMGVSLRDAAGLGQGDEPAEKAQPVMPRLSAEEGWGIDQVEPPPVVIVARIVAVVSVASCTVHVAVSSATRISLTRAR